MPGKIPFKRKQYRDSGKNKSVFQTAQRAGKVLSIEKRDTKDFFVFSFDTTGADGNLSLSTTDTRPNNNNNNKIPMKEYLNLCGDALALLLVALAFWLVLVVF